MAFIIAFLGFCVAGAVLGKGKKHNERKEWRSREAERRAYDQQNQSEASWPAPQTRR